MSAEVQKLLQEKKDLQNDLNRLQAELNKARLLILSKKNDESFVKIQKLKQSIEDFKRQIDGLTGLQSKIDALKQKYSDSESNLNKICDKIRKTESEIFTYEKMIEDKDSQIKKLASQKERFLESIQSISSNTEEDIQNLIQSVGGQKEEIQKLSKEISRISSVGADPYFLLTKSEQKLENLRDVYEGKLAYYNADLLRSMEELVPLKIQEKEDLVLNIGTSAKEKKEFYTETEKIKEEIVKLEDLCLEKKISIKERQTILKNLEEECQFYSKECERLDKLQETIKRNQRFSGNPNERIDQLRKELFDIQKANKTKENNYNNGIRSVNIRISKITSHINDLKKEIRTALEKISKLKTAEE